VFPFAVLDRSGSQLSLLCRCDPQIVMERRILRVAALQLAQQQFSIVKPVGLHQFGRLSGCIALRAQNGDRR
jgi:hypothetical protein